MGPRAHIILIGLLGFQWFVNWWLAGRLRPSKNAGGARPAADRISIIIPARNEAANLPGLLGSLAAQRIQPLEVIVVDDDSEDGTAAIAEQAGAKVIHPGPPPEGWRGKPWACQNGAAAAAGDYFLFLDADTKLVPDHGLIRLLERYPGGAWSVLPWHSMGGGAEAFSAFFNLLMALGTVPTGLAGPCLLIPRADYEACGGHDPVKARVLENVGLAAVLRKLGVATASTIGRDIIHFRMYPGGFPDLIPGWTKSFASGAATTPRATLVLIILWISSLWVAVGTLFLSPIFLIVYALYALQVGWMLRCVGKFPPWTSICYPVPLAFHLVIFLRALGPAGKRATWKGRQVGGDVD